MTEETEEDRRAARARIALVMGMYAGQWGETPRADHQMITVQHEGQDFAVTWRDLLLAVDVEHVQRYCRTEPESTP